MSFSRPLDAGLPHSSRFVKRGWLAGFGMAVSLLSVSVSCAGVVPQPPVATVTEEPAAAFEYTREVSGVDGNIEGLQVAVRRFEPVKGGGPTVSLVSAVHFGEKDYYKQLQRFLDKQDIVLYEGIKPPRRLIVAATISVAIDIVVSVLPSSPTMSLPGLPANVAAIISPTGKAETGKVSIAQGLQIAMADALNLQSQQDGINYRRPNFRSSDLFWDQLEELAAKNGDVRQKTWKNSERQLMVLFPAIL